MLDVCPGTERTAHGGYLAGGTGDRIAHLHPPRPRGNGLVGEDGDSRSQIADAKGEVVTRAPGRPQHGDGPPAYRLA